MPFISWSWWTRLGFSVEDAGEPLVVMVIDCDPPEEPSDESQSSSSIVSSSAPGEHGSDKSEIISNH
jgi:hypothetical protein